VRILSGSSSLLVGLDLTALCGLAASTDSLAWNRMFTPSLPTPLSRQRAREEHADFFVRSSKLLMRTSKLVAAAVDLDTTLAAISRLKFPHRGVWSVLDFREGATFRRIASDNVPDRPPGSVVTVDLRDGGETLGTLSFFAPLGGHVFDDRDRQLAVDVAAGASMAIAASKHEPARAQSPSAAPRSANDRFAFIEALSHGLRTPLHAIHGYAQLLDQEVRGPLNDLQRNDVHRIQANERHLLTLVNSVIGYARWDDGQPLALEDISVRTAVQLTNAVVAQAAARRGVRYDADGAIDAALTVRAEPRRLREILLQLMLNAVNFSRPQDVVIVHAVNVGTQVWIRVTDTGIGIAPEHIDSIFRPFSHGPDSRHGMASGVGLGLTITRRLAQAMGGELSVVSAVGNGSTFTLALPQGRSQ
jgi:signal transduction histidine kinase